MRFLVVAVTCLLANAAVSTDTSMATEKPVVTWACHAWRAADGLPEGPMRRIQPRPDGKILVAGATQRVAIVGDRLYPLATNDHRNDGIERVPLDPWLAAARLVARPYTSNCRTADGAVFSGHVHGAPRLQHNGSERRFASRDGVFIDRSSHVAADAEGAVWVAQSGLLAVYEPTAGRFSRRAELPVGKISLAPARDEGLWIKIDHRLYRYRESTGLTEAGSRAPHGSTILFEDTHGRLWVGSDFFGLHVRVGDMFVPVTTTGDGIFAIAEDFEGGIWAGTSTAVNRLTPSVLQALVATEKELQLANSICEDDDGRIWLATEGGWLGTIDTRSVQAQFHQWTQDDGWSGRAHCVAARADGQIFIGTRTDGIYRSSGRGFEKIDLPPGFPKRLESSEYRILNLLATRAGDLWAATQSGLFRHRAGQWQKAAINDDTSLNLSRPRALIEDEAGTVWLATASGVLCRFGNDGGGEPRGRTMPIEPLIGGPIAALTAASGGDVWAAVRDVGLLRIRDGRADLVSGEAGLPSVGIVTLAADKNGLLWCVAHRQLFAVSRAELDAVADGEQSQLHPWLFRGGAEGVVIDPADRPSCQALLARDGRIWITLRRGLVIIDPDRLVRSSEAPPLTVEAMRVGGESFSVTIAARSESIGNCVALPPDPRGVEIEIAARGFSRPSNARVAYRLDGFDTDWIEGSVDRPIRYERLPAGTYALRLRSTNDQNIWENGDQSFVITVQPLLWERPWFRATALTGAAGLAAAVAVGGATLRSRARLARLEQQAALEQQRLRIARDMHDEAGTAATQLALLADMARAMPDDRDRDERLDGMSRIARQLVTSLDEMVWAVNPGNDTLAHLVSYLGQTASETLGRFGIACRVRSDEIPDLPAEAELRRGMLMIAKEAVSNIVEHAEATAVAIDVRACDGRLTITIEDDGTGLTATPESPPPRSGGNGLGNMQARAADLGGCCRIEPAEPSGTRIVVDVPLSAKAGP